MTVDSVIAEVAAEYAGFTLEDAADDPAAAYNNQCEYAGEFAKFAVELLNEYVETNPDPVRLAQAKVRLLDRYFEWRAQVPKNHRYRMSENGHTCIFHVFERTYQRIRMVELKLVPPVMVIEVPVKAPPALPKVQGIYLGEVIGEEN